MIYKLKSNKFDHSVLFSDQFGERNLLYESKDGEIIACINCKHISNIIKTNGSIFVFIGVKRYAYAFDDDDTRDKLFVDLMGRI